MYFRGSKELHGNHRKLLESAEAKEGQDKPLIIDENPPAKINLLLLLYVDDILVRGNNKAADWFMKRVEQSFKMKHEPLANEYIGLNLDQTRHKDEVIIHQRKMIRETVNKFEMTFQRKYSTPLQATNDRDKRMTTPKLQDVKLYPSIIGCLNYIGVTSRPDISHSVTHLSQFLKEPREHDYQQALRVLTYLRDHVQRFLIYKKCKSQCFYLRTNIDSSYMNANDRRSIYG